MAGWDNEVLWGSNVDFTGNTTHQATVINDGELLIGSSVAPNIRVSTLTSIGKSVSITNGQGTINLECAPGTGNVIGPGASTDNAIVRWDGITGTLIQNSTAILDDAGVITNATWNGNTVTVPYGGTGAISLTGVLTGNGVSPFTASAVSQYNVLLGSTSNLIVSQPPSATVGYPLVSQGASANPDFTGSVNLAAGALGAPTLTWASDTTTGFYRSGADVVDLSVSSNHLMSVSSSTFGVLGSFFSFEQGLKMKSYTFPAIDTTINTTDFIIYVNQGAAINITLPAFPLDGETHIIKDYSRTAGANNITILGNGHNIDGAASYVMNVNGGSVILHYQSSTTVWSVL